MKFFLSFILFSFICFSIFAENSDVNSSDVSDVDDFLNSLNPVVDVVEMPLDDAKTDVVSESDDESSIKKDELEKKEIESVKTNENNDENSKNTVDELNVESSDESLKTMESNVDSVEDSINIDDVSNNTTLNTNTTNETNDEDSESIDYLNLIVEIPQKKRPKKPDEEKLSIAMQKDENEEEFEKTKKTIKFGTASEISSVIDEINKNEDPRYLDSLYDLFYLTNSNDIKGKLLEYFGSQEDPCLEDYAVEILDDPYDTPISVVEKCFSYVSSVGCKEAGPALVKILEAGEEKYFNGALNALGKTGGKKEAIYLTEYLKRDDLTVPQRQSLMRTLGAMCAVETWEEVCKIAQDEDENSFVRMYAAEAIGKMKKDDSVPILIKLYEEGDPNMRQYCIKGLSNYQNSEKAKNAILQGIRDDHYKVRLESIKAVKLLKIEDAVEYIAYRAKNDPENVVKQECYPTLAELNTKESNDFLIEQITDAKTSDNVKYQAADALMKLGTVGENEIITLAKESLKDDRRKSLRQNLGKLFIKYARPGYSEICVLYLQSKDTLTQSQGLELYKNAKYELAKPSVIEIANDKNAKSANKKRARKLLGLSEDENVESPNISDKTEKDLSDTNAK